MSKRFVATSRQNQRDAKRDVQEMEKLHPKKRSAAIEYVVTPDAKKKRPMGSGDSTQFLEDFFTMEENTQRECLNALLTDRRVSAILPPESIVARTRPIISSTNTDHNNSSDNFTDPKNTNL